MAIPDHIIEEVRVRADILDVVGEHVTLKRSGRTFRGPCPLHGGEGPNFSVDPQKGFFKCFVCGESGDVFSFPMKHLGMDFLSAVRHVAARAGVEIPEEREREREDPLRPWHEVNQFARDWFRRQLLADEGRAARDYLEGRGIGEGAWDRFGIGWAPESWSAFRDAAKTHGIDDERLLALGLVKQREGREPYDAFRGRIVFPIEDLGGRTVAFGGRVLEAEEHVPKYLNSPETPVYVKGRVLYGLGWSRGAVRREERALLVEGYMDYVSLAAHGVENVAAALGTAMTEEQAALVARYTKTTVLLYDSDAAGLRATFRTGDALLRAGVEVLVATLPEGEDPDSLVRTQGAKALRRFLDDAVDVLERKVQILERRDFFGSIQGTRKAIDALLPTVRAAADEVLRDVYLARIAQKTGVPRETLEREVASAPPREVQYGRDRRRAQSPGRRAEDFGAPSPAPRVPAMGPERNLLLLLFRDESWVGQAAEGEVTPEHFRDPVYRTIYETMLDVEVEGGRDPEGAWLSRFPDEVQPTVEELRGDPEGEHIQAPSAYFDASRRALLVRPFEERLREIDREMDLATADEEFALYKEKNRILMTLRERGLSSKPGVMHLRDGGR